MPTAVTVKCPICDQPAVPEYKPFCSSRHRDRDLCPDPPWPQSKVQL